jgi:hypothetical protein
MLQVNHFGRGPTPWQNSFQPFASASRKRKRERERVGGEKKQNNQPLQIFSKIDGENSQLIMHIKFFF